MLALAAVWVYHVGWAEVHASILRLNPWVALLLMAILPVFGFSIAFVYVFAGARFGLWPGVGVIAAITLCHLALTHAIARSLLRDRLERYLARHRHRVPQLPPGEDTAVSLIVSLVPGLPYFVRNYLLALTHIPLLSYASVCLPVYVIRSIVALAIGDLGSGISREKLVALLAILAVKVGICAWLVLRLRRRWPKTVAGGGSPDSTVSRTP